jgi:GAF domain-containing protein/HAMP domain-containing protein
MERLSSSWENIKLRYRRMGLGQRLTLTILPLILLPMLLLAIVTYSRSRNLLREQATDQMLSAAQAQILVLQEWASDREQRLQLGSQRSEVQQATADLLQRSPSSQQYRNSKDTLGVELEDIRLRQGQLLFSEVVVVRISDGQILSSTNPDWEGETLPAISDGTLTVEELGTSPVYDDSLVSPGDMALITLIPIQNEGEPEPGAVLVGINIGARIGTLLEDMQVFWEQRGVFRVVRGNTFVLLKPDVVIQLPRYSMVPEATAGIDHPVFISAQDAISGAAEYTNDEDTLVLSTFEFIPEWDLGIVTELPQEDIFSEVNNLAPFIFLIFLVAVALVALIVPLATRRSIKPLGNLTKFAESFSMGDLSARVPTAREDEVGQLSRTFNQMAEDLSDLYLSLERRVEARTQQIRTASEVARDAVAIRDVESLLNETVNLITSRFGFYHAGVFLIDDAKENAVLRAASSDGGKRMLERGHSIPVGKRGIVGYVTGSGKSRIALDVGEDRVHLVNPDLPETRSEIALPLWSGEEIIGALDVQSKEAEAFDEEDTLVLQTMADQLAVAIVNARLIEQLTDLSAQHRQVIEVYNRLSQLLNYDQILRDASGIIQETFNYPRIAIGLIEGDEIVVRGAAAKKGVDSPRVGVAIPLERGPMGRAITDRAPVIIEGQASDRESSSSGRSSIQATISVPLISRGNPIGAIAVETIQLIGRVERDVEIIELIASQVATSLENARLFEETQQSLDQMDAIYRRQTSESWEELFKVLESDQLALKAEYSGSRYPEAILDGGDKLEAEIKLRGESIGRLDVLGERPGSWTGDERIILDSVAEEIAVALEQMRLMEEVQRRAAYLQTAAEVARDASGLLDVDALLSRVVVLIQQRFEYDHVAVYLMSKGSNYARIRQASGTASESLINSNQQYLPDMSSIIGAAMSQKQYYLADDVSIDGIYTPHPLLPQTRSQVALPLVTGDSVLGAIDLRHNHPHGFTQDDIAVLEIISDQLSVAIQNARLFRETLQRAEREQTVMEVTGEIRASADVDTMLQTAVKSMRSALGARRARVRLFHDPMRAPDIVGAEHPKELDREIVVEKPEDKRNS